MSRERQHSPPGHPVGAADHSESDNDGFDFRTWAYQLIHLGPQNWSDPWAGMDDPLLPPCASTDEFDANGNWVHRGDAARQQ